MTKQDNSKQKDKFTWSEGDIEVIMPNKKPAKSDSKKKEIINNK